MLKEETKQFIQQFFKNKKFIIDKTIQKFLRQYPDIKQELEKELLQNSNWLNLSYLIRFTAKSMSLSTCKNCRKELTAEQTFNKNSYCSKICMMNSDEIKTKIQNTLQLHYGCNNPLQNKKIKEKQRLKTIETWKNIKENNPQKLQKVTQKIQKTCLQKYGVVNPTSLPEIRNKIKQTTLLKYGVESSTQNETIKAKIRQTTLQHYGVPCIFSLPGFHQQISQQCMQKYGVKSYQALPETKLKIKNTLLAKYQITSLNQLNTDKNLQNRLNIGYNTILSWSKYDIIPLFSRDEYQGRLTNIEYPWKCTKCGNIFKQKIYTTHFHTVVGMLPRCLHCYPFSSNTGTSLKEQALISFCKSFYPNLIEHDRTLIVPYELDIVIPELKLALEFDGNYWHSIEYQEHFNEKIENKQLKKTMLCEQIGYRLIHIWEDEWTNNLQQIQNKLKSVFNHTEIIDKTEIIDRSWLNILSDQLVEIYEPKLILRGKNHVFNCGTYKFFNK